MMLNFLGETKASQNIEKALFEVLKEGRILTKDLGEDSTTQEFKEEIIKKLAN